MTEPGGGEADPGGGSPRLLYREDDANFKRRLDAAIQFYWVWTYAITIIAAAAVAYFLGLPLYAAIIAALLLLLVISLQQTMLRIGRSGRWEVYGDRAKVPVDRKGGSLTVHYGDVDRLDRADGLGGTRLELVLSTGRRLRFESAGQEKALVALESAYKQWGSRRMANPAPLSIPVVPSQPTDAPSEPTVR